jgi:hypothetical protein
MDRSVSSPDRLLLKVAEIHGQSDACEGRLITEYTAPS